MFDFFQIVDEQHDDPTIYPVLSPPGDAFPFAWERDDGQQPEVFHSKALGVLQRTSGGWTRTRKFTDLTFTVVLTDARAIVYCEKFVKGGGWRGFGVGGLAFAAVANAVSHARAAARRKGKLLVAQVRYPWLLTVGAPPDNRGRHRSLHLIVDAGARGESRVLALEIRVPDRVDGRAYAEMLVRRAAAHRKTLASVSPQDAEACRQLAAGATRNAGSQCEIPGAVPVGTAVLPVPSMPTPQPASLPAPWPPAALPAPQPPAALPSAPAVLPLPAPPPATVAPGHCAACDHPILTGAASCGRCGLPVRHGEDGRWRAS